MIWTTDNSSSFTYLCLLFSSRSAAVATLCRVSLDATTRCTTVSTSGTCFASMNFTMPSLHYWYQIHNEGAIRWYSRHKAHHLHTHSNHYAAFKIQDIRHKLINAWIAIDWQSMHNFWIELKLHINLYHKNIVTALPRASVVVPAQAAQHSTGPLQSPAWQHRHSSPVEAGGDPGHLQLLSPLQNFLGRKREQGELGIHSAQT